MIEDALRLAFAAAVRPLHQRVLRHQLDIEAQAKIGMQPLFDVLLQPLPAGRVVAHLDLDRHLVAHDAVAHVPFGDAEPFAGGAAIALDRRQAGLRPDTDAADAHHRVAAAEHLLHAAEAAAAFAAV